MNITLTNDFHSTDLTLRGLTKLTTFGYQPALKISKTTFNKIKNNLCGSKECQCGINFGQDKYMIIEEQERYEKNYYIVIK
jgi:hypothetical protein